MRTSSRVRTLAVVLGVVVIFAWVHASLRAQAPTMSSGLGGGVGAASSLEPEEAPVATVYLTTPITAKAAQSWLKLQQSVPLAFPNEIPLEEVLKYVKDATKSKEDKGIPFYVDPVGLQEAEKTMTSPIAIDLEDVPLATSLKLALKQLGLVYYVRPDGLVVITSDGQEDAIEPGAKVLEELSLLRREVASLRRELRARTR